MMWNSSRPYSTSLMGPRTLAGTLFYTSWIVQVRHSFVHFHMCADQKGILQFTFTAQSVNSETNHLLAIVNDRAVARHMLDELQSRKRQHDSIESHTRQQDGASQETPRRYKQIRSRLDILAETTSPRPHTDISPWSELKRGCKNGSIAR